MRINRDRDRFVSLLRWLVIVLAAMLISGTARALDATEYQVKAAYLYNFTRFIEWPATALATPTAGFNVCVMGTDPFGEALAPLAQRSRDGHPIVLDYPASAHAARACHLLYIAPSEAKRVAAILAALADVPVVTVSSLPGFVERGGAIGFVQEGSHVRFAINRAACKYHGLACSAKLLEAAVLVVDNAPKEDGR